MNFYCGICLYFCRAFCSTLYSPALVNNNHNNRNHRAEGRRQNERAESNEQQAPSGKQKARQTMSRSRWPFCAACFLAPLRTCLFAPSQAHTDTGHNCIHTHTHRWRRRSFCCRPVALNCAQLKAYFQAPEHLVWCSPVPAQCLVSNI